MKIEEFICDECGKKRSGDANHWRTLEATQTDFRCLDFLLKHCVQDVADVCGQECPMKAFSRWLSTGKLRDEAKAQN